MALPAAVVVIIALVAALVRSSDGEDDSATGPTTEAPTTAPTTAPSTTALAPGPVPDEAQTAVFPIRPRPGASTTRSPRPGRSPSTSSASATRCSASSCRATHPRARSRSGRRRPGRRRPCACARPGRTGADGCSAVAGSALAFDGHVDVEVRQEGGVEPIGTEFVTGGDVARPFSARVTFTPPTAPRGALVLRTTAGKHGRVWQAVVTRVGFR